MATAWGGKRSRLYIITKRNFHIGFDPDIHLILKGMIWGELGGTNRTEENFASMDYAIFR